MFGDDLNKKIPEIMAAQMAAFMDENRQQTVSDNGCSDDSDVTAYTKMCEA